MLGKPPQYSCGLIIISWCVNIKAIFRNCYRTVRRPRFSVNDNHKLCWHSWNCLLLMCMFFCFDDYMYVIRYANYCALLYSWKFSRIGRKWAFCWENCRGMLNQSYGRVWHAQHFGWLSNCESRGSFLPWKFPTVRQFVYSCYIGENEVSLVQLCECVLFWFICRLV